MSLQSSVFFKFSYFANFVNFLLFVDRIQLLLRHHICQKIYATAIFGPKNLRKKNVNRDKIEFATKWRKCYKMTLKRENGQLTLYHHLFGNCQFCTTVHGI